jgi:hypothetical protein
LGEELVVFDANSSDEVYSYDVSVSYEKESDLTGVVEGSVSVPAKIGGENKDSGSDNPSEEPGEDPVDASPANFTLSSVSGNGPVTEGGDLDVGYTVTNEGGKSGTQDIVLKVDGVQEDSNSSVSLDGGDSVSGVLSWSTSEGDAGTYSYNVFTENDSDDGSFEVTDLTGPTASASVNNSSPETGEVVEFNASNSVAGDGSISGYDWDVDGDGNYEKNGEIVTHSYSSSGIYNPKLKLNDSNGLTDTDQTVEVFSSAYQISSCSELQNMQNDLDAYYELVSDVDCSAFDYSTVGEDSNRFIGVLNGQNYTVENLTINEGSSNYVGLIGYLGSTGEVRDIGVVNMDISGNEYVGGLVGYNNGSVSSSYSTGSVSASSGDSMGGLIGRNNGKVSNSFSSGSVSGSGPVGGLVGQNDDSVSSSYWDTESSGQSSSDGGTGLTTSEMTGDSASNNMPGLDFTGNWSEVLASDSDAVSDGYPVLQDLSRVQQLKEQGIYSE